MTCSALQNPVHLRCSKAPHRVARFRKICLKFMEVQEFASRCNELQGKPIRPEGVVTPTLNPRNSRLFEKPGAKSTNNPDMDPKLQRLIDDWPTLPVAIQAGILAMVDASRTDHPHTRNT